MDSHSNKWQLSCFGVRVQQEDDLSRRVHRDVAVLHSALKHREGEGSAQIACEGRLHDWNGFNGRGFTHDGWTDAATGHI